MKRLAISLLLSGLGFSPPARGQSIITTVAGSNFDFPGNVTSALNAPLGSVNGVAVDSKGNIYVADTSSNHIFLVGIDGSIQIVAGSGALGRILKTMPTTG